MKSATRPLTFVGVARVEQGSAAATAYRGLVWGFHLLEASELRERSALTASGRRYVISLKR